MIANELEKIIELALLEDRAFDDVTSDFVVDENYEIDFCLSPRQDIVLCGVEAMAICCKILQKSEKFADFALKYEILAKDGDKIAKNQVFLRGFGAAKLVFAAERVALNIIQHLSGIASLTADFVAALSDKNIAILDTRKTTPLLRDLEKYAVLQGGGRNHRRDLSEMVLIKDNHIAACAGDAKGAVLSAKKSGKIVEIECDNLDQVRLAIEAKPDIIMLDNMDVEKIKEACKIINKSCKIEVSGGVNLQNIGDYAGLGIDFISVGALTHFAPWVDIGLDVNEKL